MRLTDIQFLEETPRSLDLQVQRLRTKEFKEHLIGAQTTCILANVNRNTEVRPQPFEPMDFIPKHLWPDALIAKARFDRAGNIEHTNIKKMSGTEQQDFVFNLMGGRNAKKSKRGSSADLPRGKRGSSRRSRKAKATPSGTP